jgi:hypothetical protein
VGNRTLPYYSEPIEGSLRIRAPAGLNLYAWDAHGGRPRRMTAPFTDGRYNLTLERSLSSRWLMLAARPPGGAPRPQARSP